jgi:hypothetical protein
MKMVQLPNYAVAMGLKFIIRWTCDGPETEAADTGVLMYIIETRTDFQKDFNGYHQR